jgi:hypothetical protein
MRSLLVKPLTYLVQNVGKEKRNRVKNETGLEVCTYPLNTPWYCKTHTHTHIYIYTQNK